MSIIQNIRNKYAKVAGGVIALALISFVLTDAASGSLGELFGKDNNVVKVDGEKVSAQDYAKRIDEYETLYQMNSQNQNIDDNTRAQIREQALRDLINEKLIEKQAGQLGIESSEDENRALIYGNNPSPMIRNYPIFTNPETGMFDPQRVKLYEQQIMQIDPSGAEKKKWEVYKAYVLRNNIIQKYNNLISASVYSPKAIKDEMVAQQSDFVNLQFVKIPYSTINDNDVKVSDADITAYMEKRKKLFSIDQPTRSIEYVTFDVVPSAEDTLRSRDALAQIKNDFANAADAELFVNGKSDDSYAERFYNKTTFGSIYADSVLSLPIGAVYGPYLDNNVYKLAKVVDRKTLPDSVKAQHILISTQQGRTDTAAKMRADSVLQMVNAGMNFDSLAATYSEDPGSKDKGGDLGYFGKNMMVKEFDSVSFYGKTGDVSEVKTQFGYHIIKINDQKSFNPATQVAFVTKSLFPGEATENKVYAEATDFAGKYANSKEFDNGVKKLNLTKKRGDNIKVNDFMIQGIGPAREIIRWIYSGKLNDVSGIINMHDKYVVAKLVNIQEKGLMKLDDNMKPSIEAAIKAEKKADLIKKKYAGSKTLEAIAQASAQQVATADSIKSVAGFIPGIGYEQKVAGYAFYPKLALNTMSPGINGADGVFYIAVTLRNKIALDPNVAMMMESQINMQQQQQQQNFANMVIEAMKQKVEVKYNSENLY